MDQSAASANYSCLDDTNPRYPCRSSSQLTLFYDGKVNVYDNVPADKAGQIMSVAAGSIASQVMNNMNEESEYSPFTVRRQTIPADQYLQEFQRFPTSTADQGWAMACCDKFGRIQAAASAGGSTVIITHQLQESSTRILSANSLFTADAAPPKVLPVHIARKLSLSRFLERRRNRLRTIGLQAFARDHDERCPRDYNSKSFYSKG